MKRIVWFIFLFISGYNIKAQRQSDSCNMEISLLTIAPGTDLYSIFGHTAIRVQDSSRGMDIVYNYGTFDDRDPLFYVHFTRGIMNYSLSAETFSDFMEEYKFEHRDALEQVLDLSCKEKSAMYEGLRSNSLEENRFYQYHFHTDNCTTRAGKFIATHTNQPVVFKNTLPEPSPSYRDMIHEYLDKQHSEWSKFGIDLLLGKNLDIKPNNEEAMYFLPDYLYRGIDRAQTDNHTIVNKRKTLLEFHDPVKPFNAFASIWTPITVFMGILLFAFFMNFSHSKKSTGIQLIFDRVFFSLLGLAGLLIAGLWLGRVDTVCRDNMNILWALPTHIVTVFFIRNNATWVKTYFLITAILASILLLGFPWWNQRMNTSVIPLLMVIIFRSFQIFKTRIHAEKHTIQGSAVGI